MMDMRGVVSTNGPSHCTKVFVTHYKIR